MLGELFNAARGSAEKMVGEPYIAPRSSAVAQNLTESISCNALLVANEARKKCVSAANAIECGPSGTPLSQLNL